MYNVVLCHIKDKHTLQRPTPFKGTWHFDVLVQKYYFIIWLAGETYLCAIFLRYVSKWNLFKRTGSIHVEYQCRYNFCWSSSESYDCHILLKWRKNIKRGLSYRRIYCFMDYSVVCHKALSYLTWSSIHYLLLVKFCTSSKLETS